MRPIDADKAYIYISDRVREEIRNMPTIDIVPRKRGRWIRYKTLNASKCSICGETFEIETKFCPKCGARMEGVE